MVSIHFHPKRQVVAHLISRKGFKFFFFHPFNVLFDPFFVSSKIVEHNVLLVVDTRFFKHDVFKPVVIKGLVVNLVLVLVAARQIAFQDLVPNLEDRRSSRFIGIAFIVFDVEVAYYEDIFGPFFLYIKFVKKFTRSPISRTLRLYSSDVLLSLP